MTEERTDDPLLERFQQWQLGIAPLVVMGIAAGVVTIVLQVLDVPYDIVGVIAGPAIAFLAISYWYFGR